MSPSVALWVVGILTVVTGLVIWRVLAGGRTTADPVVPIVEGDLATATGDQEPHSAVEEVSPPVVVAEEPAPAKEEVAPATANPAAESTAPPATDAAEPSTEVAEPATVPAEPAVPATIPTPRAAAEDSTASEAEPAPPVAAPLDGPADDFRKIQGIGPKMAAGLQAAGIRTYHQLAELDEAALRETIKAAGLRATPSVATWPQQAKVLAGQEA